MNSATGGSSRLARLLGLLSLGLLLTVASGKRRPHPARSLPFTWEVSMRRQRSALAAEFEQADRHPRQIVDATLSSLREKELTDLLTRAGNYDVMQIPYQWEGEILPHLRPLNDVVSRIAPDLQDFIPTVRTNCGQWGECIYGLPMACDVITLLYRTDVFAARSAEFQRLTGRPLQPPRTWQEYLEIARFLNSESLYGNIIMGGDQCYTIWSGILYGMGGRPVDEQWRPVLNSEAGVQSLSLFVEMFNYAPSAFRGSGSGGRPLCSSRAAGRCTVTWPSLVWAQMKDTKTYKIAGKIGAAVIPGGKAQLSSWSLGVNPACKDLDAGLPVDLLLRESGQYQAAAPAVWQGLTTNFDLFGPGMQREDFLSGPVARRVWRHSTTLSHSSSPRSFRDYLDNELLKAIKGQTTPRAALESNGRPLAGNPDPNGLPAGVKAPACKRSGRRHGQREGRALDRAGCEFPTPPPSCGRGRAGSGARSRWSPPQGRTRRHCRE